MNNASVTWRTLEAGHIEEKATRTWRGSDPGRWNLLVTVSGNASVRNEHGMAEMEKGDLVLCSPSKIRFHSITDYWESYWLLTDQNLPVNWEKISPGIWKLSPGEELFRRLLEDITEIHELVFYRFDNWYPISRNLLENIILRGNSCTQCRQIDQNLLDCAVFLTDRVRIPPMEQVAARFGMSRTALFKAFKRSFGTTPLDYHESAKFRQVIRFMQSRDLRFSEIAERCAFPSVFYLSKRFKKRFGVSMREFQKTIMRSKEG